MSLENQDFDFTRPGAIDGLEVQEDHISIGDKVLELKKNIASTERGIELAKKLGDAERTAQMVAKKEEFEETLDMLTPKADPAKEEFWATDMDNALGSERANLVKRTEDWQNRNPGKGLNSVGGEL